MRKYPLFITITIVLIFFTICVGLSFWSRASLQKLEYDEVHFFQVGKHQVTIETQSYSYVNADNGLAQIIVITGSNRTVLESHFNNDLYMDIRPGYISWENVDNSRGLDLLIWIPERTNGTGDLIAHEYISNEDGRLYILASPLRRRLDW